MDKLVRSANLKVKQLPEPLETVTGISVGNKYEIFDHDGKKLYKATETTDDILLQVDGTRRPFIIEVKDSDTDKVAMMIRRANTEHCVFPWCKCRESCKDFVSCESPTGTILGYVKQEYNGCDSDISVRDASANVVLRLRGPRYCTCNCAPLGAVEFRVFSTDGTHDVGKIARMYRGYASATNDADEYRIDVPVDLDSKMKSLLVAGAIMIDYMFFEIRVNLKRKKRVHDHQ